MGSGGKVANNAGAIITGGFDGLSSGSGSLTLTNAGSITGTAGVAVNINDPGSTDKAMITNSTTGAISGDEGVEISGEGRVVNAQTITATNGKGVLIGGGGAVNNEAGATISGTAGGAEVDGGGSVTNNGSITASATSGFGVSLGGGGALENLAATSKITGGEDGVSVGSGSAAVVNAGTITGTHGVGVTINDPGSTNKATVANAGQITGASGVEISGAGDLVNSATITGTSGKAVAIGGGGMVANATPATITGTAGGVELDGGGTVINNGSIVASGANSDGVDLGGGGKVANQGTAAKISGADNGVSVGSGTATIANAGTITGVAGTGVTINGNGSITNAKAISGASGVSISEAGDIINSGSIKATSGVGVTIGGVGEILNQKAGSIVGVAGGVTIDGANAILVNAGSVTASGSSSDGVKLASGGVVDNLAGASIAGKGDGVLIDGAGVVETAGSISGVVGVAITGVGTVVDDGSITSTTGADGTAVSLEASGSTFELAYGATLNGGVAGFQAGDTLELGDDGMTITTGTTSVGPAGMTTVTLKDGSKTVVSINLVGNFIGDTFTVTPIGGAKTVAVTLGTAPTTVTVAGFEAQEATLNGIAGGFDISDTSANINAGFANIEGDEAHIDSIVSTTAILNFGVANFVADEPALNKVVGGFELTGTGANIEADLDAIEADIGHVTTIDVSAGTVSVSIATILADQLALDKFNTFAVVDSAAAISNGIDTFEALAAGGATIKSITFTDLGTPVLNLTQGEVTDEASLLAKIVGAYDLDVTGAFGEPYDAYDKQFNATHQLVSETFFLPGPVATVGKITLPTAPSAIDLAIGTYLGSAVDGFKSGDTVDFQSVTFDAADTVTFTENAAKTGGTVAIDDSPGARWRSSASSAHTAPGISRRRRTRMAIWSSDGRRPPRATRSKLLWRWGLPISCCKIRPATFASTGWTSASRCPTASPSPMSAITPMGADGT